ncbi:MAG: AarF/ABC1/UbiB kinase family protein [Aeriscardovia sp.]|nr:AarF/ABC1/UbiB kinase family protein [Aeriscardovia sp.]
MSPEKLCKILQALGPTFVKVGQILSMRSEILPQAYCEALASLRSHADPMPYSTVLNTLEHEYGRNLSEIFDFIDRKPLGSASVAQVHYAKLVTGESVAVKVQRPGVREMMAQDIAIIRSVVKFAMRIGKDSQLFDLKGVVEEIWTSFRMETDFLVEARNLQEFREFTNQFAYMDCPKVYMSLCTHKVVVMDYIQGIPLAHTRELKEEGYSLKEIGTKLVDNYASQILDRGFFHADPHPGNIIIRGGQIVLIDMGIMGRLNAHTRNILRDIIFALAVQDSASIEESLLKLSPPATAVSINRANLLSDIDIIVSNFATIDLQDLNMGEFILSLLQLMQRNGLEIPSSLILVSRALVTLEGTISEFIPDVNMVEIIENHLKENGMRKGIKKEVSSLSAESLQATHGLLESLSYTKTAVKQLTRGNLKINAELVGSQTPLRQLSYIIDRLTMAIIIAGLFVGSSIVYYARIRPVVFGIPIVGMLGYIVAFCLGVWIIVDSMRRNHQLRKKSRHK